MSAALAPSSIAAAPPLPARPWNALFGPLNLAAYLTWIAIGFGPLAAAWSAGRSTLGMPRIAGLAALVLQLVLFVACGVLREARQHPGGQRLLILLQAAASLVAVWGLLPNGSVPVLLILVAAQLAQRFPLRATIGWMVAINAVLAALLIDRWSAAEALPILLAYVGFEIFATLTTTYARRAEEANDALGRINAELLATRHLLLESARSEERLRLSRELHDVAGHKLTALKLQLRVVEAALPPPQRLALDDCARLADELLGDVRGVVDLFRRHDGIDLAAALNALVPALPRPRVTLAIAADVRVPRLEPAQALLRCAQEGLTNALRHGDAAHVRIALFTDGDELVLQVEDDGRAAALPVPGNGLRGMAERLTAVHGRLVVETVQGGGLRLNARLPRVAGATAC